MSQRLVHYLIGPNVYAFQPRPRTLSTAPLRAPYPVASIGTGKVQRTAKVILLAPRTK